MIDRALSAWLRVQRTRWIGNIRLLVKKADDE